MKKSEEEIATVEDLAFMRGKVEGLKLLKTFFESMIGTLIYKTKPAPVIIRFFEGSILKPIDGMIKTFEKDWNKAYNERLEFYEKVNE